ncbi:MAG: sugar ABC transporter ATP-binding protein [Gemmataceae bacterium]|nr:sugar ABC transporter ATP-binding protein [Gemmataceae bacterium]MCI0741250.1 sugar ABC transporter ATP-binding protein [Gemmataceae bacterium]
MAPFLQAQSISKSFPGVQALARVDLRADAGEILAVVGENGAGKSTLMKILGGVYRPDEGTISIEGRPVDIHRVHDAERLGIVLIHQELNLAEHLDVAGNVFLGREPTRGGFLRLIDPVIYDDAERITRRLGLESPARTLVTDLTVGQQQLVEIGRALSMRSRLLILDEPTSSLTERESGRLFEVLRELKRSGLSIVYISHRLREVEEIADRVAVLRDGKNAGELSREQINHEAIVRLMVGRELKQFFHRTAGRASQPERQTGMSALQVRNVRWSPKQNEGISFSLRAGELVGLAGLMGAGRTELAETIFGVRRRLSGEFLIDGRPVSITKPAQAIAAGIYLVPEDRRREGLVLAQSVKNNISLASMDLVSRLKLVQAGRERALAQGMSDRLKVRTPGLNQEVALLSGGNQQKVVLAKWLCRTPRVLILDEPTRGIDVGAKSEIYALMDQLAQQGLAMLMISSDLEEILGMSDRVLVLHEGRLAGELQREQLSEEAVMRLATGGGQ